MDISSISLGSIVLAAAAMLEWKNVAFKKPVEASELDQQYFGERGRSRRVVHMLLALIGGLSIAAGVVGRTTPMFALLWAAVPLVIFIVVVLAMRDAWQTHLYHDRKLPEIQRATLPSIEEEVGPTDAAE